MAVFNACRRGVHRVDNVVRPGRRPVCRVRYIAGHAPDIRGLDRASGVFAHYDVAARKQAEAHIFQPSAGLEGAAEVNRVHGGVVFRRQENHGVDAVVVAQSPVDGRGQARGVGDKKHVVRGGNARRPVGHIAGGRREREQILLA